MIVQIKKYISEHRIIRGAIALVAIAGVLVLFYKAIGEKLETGIKEFQVDVQYVDNAKKLINSEYVKNLVRKDLGYDISKSKIKDLDLSRLEKMLNNDVFIDSAEVYVTSRSVVVAVITQKNPLVRINGKNEQFYLDTYGNYLPLSPIAAVRVPVVTGNVGAFLPAYKNEKEHQFQDIYELVLKINSDSFLEALVEQIHIEKSGDFLLIPKIGKEKIILGDIYNLENKIFNLKQFYKEGLTRVGWGKYAYLNLKYEDLVYAQK